MKKFGMIFLIFGACIIIATFLSIVILAEAQKDIFIAPIDISHDGKVYEYNFIDRYWPEKEVVIKVKRRDVANIDVENRNVFNGELKLIIKALNGEAIYDKIIKKNLLMKEEHSSEDINLVIAEYKRPQATNFLLEIDILKGDLRYKAAEQYIIIRNPPVYGEVWLHYLFGFFIGIICLILGIIYLIAGFLKHEK